MEDVARDADELLGDENEARFMVDESSFLKKGKSSVAVQRQWSGRAGKIEGCQVGVYASLARGDEFALVDFGLYLPEDWAVGDHPTGHGAVSGQGMAGQASPHGACFAWLSVFMAREKRKKRAEFPLLSYRDIGCISRD